jgi:excisionase family DNA binding protein
VSTDVEPIVTSIKGAAQRGAVSRDLIYKLMADGSLPYVRLGRCVRIRIADIDALLDGRNQTAA